MQKADALKMTPEDRRQLESWARSKTIQALDRTQPGLPLKRGRCGTMTHDYKRHGTTTLFTALNTLDGTVIGDTMPKHRHQEWLKFLKQIYRLVARDKEIHIVRENYATHNTIPKPFIWTATHADILGKVARAKAAVLGQPKP